ncbi:type II toxin-antitoxin system RelE/ParE family toxin [Limosilactobacillus albertensis]|uniref:Type II toxin-antitoxin system RelE/ParE family toxin n=1 Tax=Limosilactobacillus albertensis TaxID=2759752 RepID=A0A839H298_9LACO|nr:type II toxin-antitoxin system RelE/ParE family toxin [Limosilactobacillus albertensis]MBB1124021.1 type II toxin-antitoxin system RelE/ParE family toxin [Limosilactobacillus albertensis]MCD7121768.1 type II toxin-antitoxin system RelE/ParE family toxin [Limosilactobacillus albertensis]
MKVIEFGYYDWDEFEEYLDSLSDKDAAKLLAVINNIEEQGLSIAERQKWTKKLESNLYEIRSKHSSNIQRAIYFHWENNKYVITQGFTKKTQKTPRREIRKGLRRRNIYEGSHQHEQN